MYVCMYVCMYIYIYRQSVYLQFYPIYIIHPHKTIGFFIVFKSHVHGPHGLNPNFQTQVFYIW